MLVGEVAGCQTYPWSINDGEELQLEPLQGHSRIVYLMRGSGTLINGSYSQPFCGLCVFVPQHGSALTISATQSVLLLEVRWQMAVSDSDVIESGGKSLPYYIDYAQAKTYKEEFKSPKTVSRTLVPPGIVPRFATGSVQTTGPDAVGEHAHPMLEQFFLGLPGNNCTVSADGTRAALGDCELLHIPLGSMHGVTVDEGSELHYIWIDLFGDRSGEKWISDMHNEDDA